MIGATFCVPLKWGVTLLAVLDIIIAFVMFIMSIGGEVYFETHQEQVLKIFDDPSPDLINLINLQRLGAVPLRIFLSFNTLYWLQKIGLGILLVMAVVRQSLGFLRVWMIYTLVLLCFSVCFFLSVICLEVAEAYFIPLYVVTFLMREYSMWIVALYLRHLQISKGNFSNA